MVDNNWYLFVCTILSQFSGVRLWVGWSGHSVWNSVNVARVQLHPHCSRQLLFPICVGRAHCHRSFPDAQRQDQTKVRAVWSITVAQQALRMVKTCWASCCCASFRCRLGGSDEMKVSILWSCSPNAHTHSPAYAKYLEIGVSFSLLQVSLSSFQILFLFYSHLCTSYISCAHHIYQLCTSYISAAQINNANNWVRNWERTEFAYFYIVSLAVVHSFLNETNCTTARFSTGWAEVSPK